MTALLERKDRALDDLHRERDSRSAERDVLSIERDHFKVAYETAETERSHLKVAYEEAEAEAERQRLDKVLQQLLRRQSGPKSERLASEQFHLALESIEQDLESAAAAAEATAAGDPEESRQRRKRAPAKRNLGHLPEHLPHDETRIEPEDTTCPCCGGPLHAIGVETTKRLHIIPMKLRVRVIHGPKYGCRTCAEAMVQAPAPRQHHPRRSAHRGAARPHRGGQVSGRPAGLSPVPDLRPRRRHPRPPNPVRLAGADGVVGDGPV